MRELLQPTDADLRAALARAREAGGYGALLEQKRQLEQAGEAAARGAAERILAGPALFTLDYSAVDTTVGFSFTPFGLTRVDAERTIYSLVPLRAELGGRASFQQDAAAPTLHDARAKTVRFQLAAPIEAAAVARALGLARLSSEALADLDLALPGVRIQAEKAVLSAHDGGVELKLVP